MPIQSFRGSRDQNGRPSGYSWVRMKRPCIYVTLLSSRGKSQYINMCKRGKVDAHIFSTKFDLS